MAWESSNPTIMISLLALDSIELILGIMKAIYANDFPCWQAVEQTRLLPVSEGAAG
jgi:threonyl-tRNA synthetase